MKKLSDLEYLKLNKFQRLGYNFLMFLAAIPLFFVKLGKGIVKFFVTLVSTSRMVCWIFSVPSDTVIGQ